MPVTIPVPLPKLNCPTIPDASPVAKEERDPPPGPPKEEDKLCTKRGIKVATFAFDTCDRSFPMETPTDGPTYCAVENPVEIPKETALAIVGTFGPLFPVCCKARRVFGVVGGTLKNPLTTPAPA